MDETAIVFIVVRRVLTSYQTSTVGVLSHYTSKNGDGASTLQSVTTLS